MQLNLIIETNDAEIIWNALRLANTALDEGHEVETFLLGAGVEASTVQTDKFNPSGLLRKYLQSGGELQACGTCLDSRDMEENELRPRSTMSELLRIVEDGDRVLTFG